eukprot:m.64227 g.64227  ORF g.64227 m.64227 type:complete len:489 (+) comp9706_c0_seq1:1521-2987(+)
MESTLQLCQFLLFLSKAPNMLRGTVRLVGVIGLASWVRPGSTGSLPPRETDPRGQSLPLVPVPPSAHNSDPTGRGTTGAIATRGAPPPAPSTCGVGCRRWVFPDAVDTHGARCLDGSPPGFYHRPGRGSDASNFLVYSHGGSWCYDLNSSDTSATWNCLVRSGTYEGSSDFNPPSGPPRHNMNAGIMSSDCTVNPHFCNWTVVYFMYCDGSSWSSDRDLPHLVGNKTVWSRGLRNLHALWDRMLAPARYNATAIGFDISTATRVVVTGASAGGFMTFYHCDRIRGLIPDHIPTHCVPDCGFWPEHPSASGVAVWQADMRAMVTLHNASGGLDASCVSANPADPSFCAHPVNVLPHISTPVFVSSSRFDTDATSDIVFPGGAPANWPASERATLVPCFTTSFGDCHPGYARDVLASWNATILAGIQPAAKSSTAGYFLNACYRHHNIDGTYSFATKIDGISLVQAVANWVLGLPGPTKLIDYADPALCH